MYTKKALLLGGGQLGRMLLPHLHDLGMHTTVVDPDADAPCKALCHQFIVADLLDYKALEPLAAGVDVAAIEIEHVSPKFLEHLERNGAQVYPPVHVLRNVQDKGTQKKFFVDNDLPTLPYWLIDTPKELEKHKDKLPFYQKARRGGYDGKGVASLKTETDFANALPVPSVLEKAAMGGREIAVIVCRNSAGEEVSLPPVEVVADSDKNLLSHLYSPLEDQHLEKEVVKVALATARAYAVVGLLAVEFFVLEDKVYINEVAPRPHNTGHHTREACTISQFELLARCMGGLSLPTPKQHTHAALINLIGAANSEGKPNYERVLEDLGKLPFAYPTFYGKKLVSPGRKMGHVTLLGSDRRDLEHKAAAFRNLVVYATG